MQTTITYELAQTRIADLHRRARHERLARAAAHTPGPRRRTHAVERTAAALDSDPGRPPSAVQPPAPGKAGNQPRRAVTVATS